MFGIEEYFVCEKAAAIEEEMIPEEFVLLLDPERDYCCTLEAYGRDCLQQGIYDTFLEEHFRGDGLSEEDWSVCTSMKCDSLLTALAASGRKVPEYCYSKRLCGGGQSWYRARVSISQRAFNRTWRGMLRIRRMNVEATMEMEQNRRLAVERDRAKEADRAKSEFISRLSHELRNSLNVILGYAESGKKHCETNEKLNASFEGIDRAGRQLLYLVNDLLDLTGLEKGKLKMNWQRVNLQRLLFRLWETSEERFRKKNVELRLDTFRLEHSHVTVDENRLNQVLSNLLSNACKYTESGGKVSLTVTEETVDQNNARFRFAVKDSGIGIAPEFLPTLFDPYVRSEAVRDTDGVGLGLPIVREIVRQMGGRIRVESVLGVGTVFTVELILNCKAVTERDREKEKRSDVGGLKGMQILLVEDSEINRWIVRELLENDQVVIVEAKDGAEALEKLKEKEPGAFQAILMDLRLPGMNGYETTRNIRKLAEPGRAETPIIAMTANAYAEDRAEALKSGMNAYLTKPFRGEQLREMLAGFARRITLFI